MRLTTMNTTSALRLGSAFILPIRDFGFFRNIHRHQYYPYVYWNVQGVLGDVLLASPRSARDRPQLGTTEEV